MASALPPSPPLARPFPPWPMDRHSSALLHEAACPLVWRKFSTLEGSTAYWTPPGSVPVAAVVHSGIDLGSSAE
eukprot:7379136-Prymnesium_polylepis.1